MGERVVQPRPMMVAAIPGRMSRFILNRFFPPSFNRYLVLSCATARGQPHLACLRGAAFARRTITRSVQGAGHAAKPRHQRWSRACAARPSPAAP